MIKIRGSNYLIGIQDATDDSDTMPKSAVLLNQIHSNIVLLNPSSGASADGMIFRKGQGFPALRVADCLPVFFIWEDFIGAAHAGWRGLAEGIIENLVSTIDKPLKYLILGPCICKECYEVGEEVAKEFPEHFSRKSVDSDYAKYSVDLRENALSRVNRITDKSYELVSINDCTFESIRLHSYRRNKTKYRNYIWLAETESALHIHLIDR